MRSEISKECCMVVSLPGHYAEFQYVPYDTWHFRVNISDTNVMHSVCIW